MTNNEEPKKPEFTEKFREYVCPGDSIQCEHNGFTIIARIERDDDYKIDDDDCHNPDPNVTGCTPEQQKRLIAAREAWLKDEWFYCGVVLSVWRNGIHIEDYAASLWGIEANYPQEYGQNPVNHYLTDVANELLPEALEAAEKRRQSMISRLTRS